MNRAVPCPCERNYLVRIDVRHFTRFTGPVNEHRTVDLEDRTRWLDHKTHFLLAFQPSLYPRADY